MTEILGQLKPDGRMPDTPKTSTTVPVVDVPVVNNDAPDPSHAVTPDNNGAATPSKIVYLAETTSDLSKERDLVRDELRLRGYGVLPEMKLPLESCDALAAAVRATLPAWRFAVPAGGLSLWVELDAPRSSALAAVADRHGVRVAAGPRFGVDGAFERNVRLPFNLPEPLLEQAVERLAVAWRAVAPDAGEAQGGAVAAPALVA
jgi:hypothetical protein